MPTKQITEVRVLPMISADMDEIMAIEEAAETISVAKEIGEIIYD